MMMIPCLIDDVYVKYVMFYVTKCYMVGIWWFDVRVGLSGIKIGDLEVQPWQKCCFSRFAQRWRASLAWRANCHCVREGIPLGRANGRQLGDERHFPNRQWRWEIEIGWVIGWDDGHHDWKEDRQTLFWHILVVWLKFPIVFDFDDWLMLYGECWWEKYNFEYYDWVFDECLMRKKLLMLRCVVRWNHWCGLTMTMSIDVMF